MSLKPEERGLCLIHLLIAAANSVSAGNMETANTILQYISDLATPNGDTMQRIAAYFTQALADRLLKNWPGLHRALNSTNISDEIAAAHNLFFQFCPFLKLAYVITNEAILEAMEGEKFVHVIDLHCFEPAQWLALIRALSGRPEGPPHLRITGLHQHKHVLDRMARRLNEEAESLDVAFQFCPLVVGPLENLEVGCLRVKTGEAVAISSPLQMHSLMAYDERNLDPGQLPGILHGGFLEKEVINSHLINLDPGQLSKVLHMNHPQTLGGFLEKEVINSHKMAINLDSRQLPKVLHMKHPQTPSGKEVINSPKMASFLNTLWGLSPKIMVVTEQESSHNGGTLMERMMEALNYYAALFDCLESSVTIGSVERQKIERMVYGEEIKNIIACEGVERKERHEKLERWIPRLELAGFGRVALSYNVMIQARRLLQSYNYDGYKVKDENGCFIICWHDQPLFSVSAWRFRP